MFRDAISTTPFVSAEANTCFGNINGEWYQGDVSFVSTLRALIGPRIKEDEQVFAYVGSSSISKDQIQRYEPSSIISNVVPGSLNEEDEKGIVYIGNLYNTHENNMDLIDLLNKYLPDLYKGYKRLEDVTTFFEKTFNVTCFINSEKKNVMIFVDGIDLKKFHYLQCATFAFLPWYFDKKVGITELEMNLIKSLRENSPANYMKYLKEMASAYDFRSTKIHNLLADFESHFEVAERDKVRNEILEIERQISNYSQAVNDLLINRRRANTRLCGLEAKISGNSGESEMMDYFLCNKKLDLVDVGTQNMTFIIKDYLAYFDKEIVESVLDNSRSYAYRYSSRFDHDKVKRLLSEIFLEEDPKLHIKTCAAYRISFGGRVSGLAHYTFGYEYADCMPNMHIHMHACLGDYEMTLNDLVSKCDYIGAVEQCIASCKSLNWGDGVVLEEFMECLFGGEHGNNKCIELPDGSVVKAADAIKWLDAQE